MKATMPQSEYHDWQRYYAIEPWGAWRDNLHAAIIAREIRRPQLQPNAANDLDDFFYEDPSSRRKRKKANVLRALRAAARPRKAKDRQ